MGEKRKRYLNTSVRLKNGMKGIIMYNCRITFINVNYNSRGFIMILLNENS